MQERKCFRDGKACKGWGKHKTEWQSERGRGKVRQNKRGKCKRQEK